MDLCCNSISIRGISSKYLPKRYVKNENVKWDLDNYKDYAVVLDDRFGSRLAKFLTEEQLEKIGFKYDGDEPYPEPKEWTRENILEQLKSDVEFGFEKALDQRGISASLIVLRGTKMESSSRRGLRELSWRELCYVWVAFV